MSKSTQKKQQPKRRDMVEYAIFKMYRSPAHWDGPYKKLSQAVKDFKEHYVNPAPLGQDFAIFKITYHRLKVPCPPKRKSR